MYKIKNLLIIGVLLCTTSTATYATVFDNLGKSINEVREESSKSQFMYLVEDVIQTHRMGFKHGSLVYEFRDYRDNKTVVMEITYSFWENKCSTVIMKTFYPSLTNLEEIFKDLRDGATNYKKGEQKFWSDKVSWGRSDTYTKDGKKYEAYISYDPNRESKYELGIELNQNNQ